MKELVVSMYRYSGAMELPIPADRLVTSIFSNSGKFFIAVEDEFRKNILRFDEFTPGRRIIPPAETIEVKEGDELIYSYLTHEHELVFGRREEFELQILKHLYSNKINIHAKLLISSFLKFFQTTMHLSNRVNDDLKSLNSNIETEPLQLNTFLDKGAKQEWDKHDLYKIVCERYEKLKQVNSKISADDIVYLHNNKVFFLQYSSDIENVVNKDCLKEDNTAKIIGKIINTFINKDRQVLSDLLHSQTEAFDFMLLSAHVECSEEAAESFLSTEADNVSRDDSVLDISMKIDKSLHDKTDDHYEIGERASEAALYESVEAIIKLNL